MAISKLKNLKSSVSYTPRVVVQSTVYCKGDIKYNIKTPVELPWQNLKVHVNLYIGNL